MINIKYVRNYYTEEQISKYLEIDKVLYGALFCLYGEQTDEEKSSGTTTEHNGVGFNAYDAPFLSAMVKSYNQYGHLTNGQKEKTIRILRKYLKQLTRLANDKRWNKEVMSNA